jgi:hypothetical protein
MAKVYRARDTRLKRDVALKIRRRRSPPIPSASLDSNEAELLAALNHPHREHLRDRGRGRRASRW